MIRIQLVHLVNEYILKLRFNPMVYKLCEPHYLKLTKWSPITPGVTTVIFTGLKT